MKKVTIIDGNNFFWRVFFKAAVKGNFSKTLKGLVSSINLMRKNSLKGQRVLLTFDTCKSEKRLKLHPEYKGKRKSSLPPEMFELAMKVLPAFVEIFKYSGLSVFEGEGYEADDYIAMLSFMLRNRNLVSIMSTDGDFPQLVTQSVSIYQPTKQINITSESFINMIGIPIKYYLDMKCMAGDKSDNIPGIAGVGEKTAMKYINEFGSYEEICEGIKEKSKQNKTDKKILEAGNLIKFNRELMDLDLCKADTVLKTLIRDKVQATKFDRDKLYKLLCEYEISEMLDTFTI